MKKNDIIAFFDSCAPGWDADMIKDDAIIGKILDNAEICEGMDVLDVACGTGVLFDYYLDRGVKSVTGIDISPEMAKIATEKYTDESRVQVLCADVEEYPFTCQFDRIVVYNAFPHFPDPAKLIRVLAGLLKEDGRLTIAHGQCREAIDNHHSGPASKVSMGLMEADALKKLFDANFDVEVVISNRHMYQVSGVKKTSAAHLPMTAPAETDVSVEELTAMLRYLVRHNEAHAREVAALAGNLMDAGKKSACLEILKAVEDFDQVNAKLSAVLNKLTQEAF